MSVQLKPEYLGDGVYVHHDQWHIVLTTGHHDQERADNKIYLEPHVWAQLMQWYERLKRDNPQNPNSAP